MTNDKNTEPSLDEMAEQISEMERQLRDMRQAYRDKKFSGLKLAMEARKSAEEAVNDELKSLGIRTHSAFRGSIWW